MNCERYLDLISARLDGPLSPEDEADLSAHLNTCPECRAIADDLSGIHSALSGAAAVPPAELADGVMKVVRGQHSRHRRTWQQLSALAACLVLCIGLLTLFHPENSEVPLDLPNMARHVVPPAQTEGLPTATPEELSFTNEQRLRLSGMSTSFEPTADLLGNPDAVAKCFARFPYNDLSAVADSYDEDFFLTHRLLAVVVCEPSSSITHTISSVTEDSATLLRAVPEAGDSDVALWLILAEVDGSGPETALTLDVQTN